MFNRKPTLLNRYHTQEGVYIIDIAVESGKDLFNRFSRTFSFRRKELDNDFAEYVYTCADEIRKRPFLIRLEFSSDRGTSSFERRIKKSIGEYFDYKTMISQKKISDIIKRSGIHLFISLTLISLTLLFTSIPTPDTALFNLFFESLTIASWVIMWPIFSDFLYDWRKEAVAIQTYQRIICSPIEFVYAKR